MKKKLAFLVRNNLTETDFKNNNFNYLKNYFNISFFDISKLYHKKTNK